MRTEWDYTDLADAYLERPEYAPETLQKLFDIGGLKKGDLVCDVGAGVAHLTIPLAEFGFVVDAVEPNDAMRMNGINRTSIYENVRWLEGTGEDTGCPTGEYDFVSFGSSFNVCDRELAMKEVNRLLKNGKWFTCMWNHRQLDDPIQNKIEMIIKDNIDAYGYGTRRESQTEIINSSPFFHNVIEIEGTIIHRQKIKDTVEAWRSHATLYRQANGKFPMIIKQIESYLESLDVEEINIPYTTRAWIAQKK